jgi:hypothetical protein
LDHTTATMKKSLVLLLGLSSAASLSAATLTGLWEFDNAANLAEATVGDDLTMGTAPTYNATLADDNGTALAGTVTTGGGTGSYFRVAPNIPANGGGSYVNQYSFVIDLFTPAGSRDSWRALFQTNNQPDGNDADYWINTDNTLGVGNMGYSTGAIDQGKWTRLVVTVDLTQAGGAGAPKYITYLDGVHFYDHPGTSNGGVDGRFSLYAASGSNVAYFFADNTDSENPPMNVGAIAIYDGVLTPTEVAALGVAGDPVPEPSSASVLLIGFGLSLLGFRRRW